MPVLDGRLSQGPAAPAAGRASGPEGGFGPRKREERFFRISGSCELNGQRLIDIQQARGTVFLDLGQL
ncbi:unnamed protein product [Rangifer tarandus platyrhynchus]|uniref:Uncharacterized protein n=1 Tax=Rangifer tarandus platyrhynchus TaxID=3082113 RepID=A0ABN8ZIQ0_RANTA|nr:unnamed protein product [Rangifer tarandus platyrhynchus]